MAEKNRIVDTREESRRTEPERKLGAEAGYPQPQTRTGRILLIAIPLLIALLSIFVVGRLTTKAQFHARSLEALEENKRTVMELMGYSTAASAAITLIPGDVATPIAEKLVDISGYFIIVICAIYLEKFLLTITCYVAFYFLIPIGCILYILPLFTKVGGEVIALSKKLLLLGLILPLIIPISVKISHMIEDTYDTSFEATIQAARDAAMEVEGVSQEEAGSASSAGGISASLEAAREEYAGGSADVAGETGSSDPSGDTASGLVKDGTTLTEGDGAGGNWLTDLWDSAAGSVSGVRDRLTVATKELEAALNYMIDALAILIVTTCLIPIVVILFFIWLINTILHLNIRIPVRFRKW
jgi:hypothetical protein